MGQGLQTNHLFFWLSRPPFLNIAVEYFLRVFLTRLTEGVYMYVDVWLWALSDTGCSHRCSYTAVFIVLSLSLSPAGVVAAAAAGTVDVTSSCVYIFVCVHLRVCTSSCVYIFGCVHLRVCTSSCVYIFVCVHLRVCTSSCVYIFVCVHLRGCTSSCVYIFVCVHLRVCTSSCVYIFVCVHLRVCTSSCV